MVRGLHVSEATFNILHADSHRHQLRLALQRVSATRPQVPSDQRRRKSSRPIGYLVSDTDLINPYT